MEFNEEWFDTCSKVGCAAKIGNIQLLKQLIKENCPVDVADNRGWKPLHEAAAVPPTVECLEELLKHEKTDINWQTHEGESALLLVCKRRQGSTANEFIKLLLQHGADPNIRDNESDTPLLQAVRNENEILVEMLVTAGADVNVTDCSGWSPLHQAASSQNPTLVNFLLKNGASIDARDECKLTPVFSAAQHGCEKSLKALLDVAKEKGNLHTVVNMGAEDWATSLMIAAQQGFEACVKLLLDYGADPNLKTSDNAMALHMAVQANSTTCLEILLQNMFLEPIIQAFHPETYDEDSGMICPLHLAIEWRNYASLKVLLEAGFAPDSLYYCRYSTQVTHSPYICDPDCESALSFACFKKDTTSIAILLSSGADPSPPVPLAFHPACRAILVNNIEALQILIECGTDLNYQREESPTNEVFLSAMYSTRDIMRLLLYHGCDPNLSFQISNSYFLHSASKYIVKNGLTLREFLRFILPYLIVSPRMQYAIGTLRRRYDEDVADIMEEISHPSPLQQMCIIKIRQHLYSVHRNKLPFIIHQLNLPRVVTQLLFCSSS